MDRARAMLGPVQKPYRYLHVAQSNLHHYADRATTTELDVEETLTHHQKEPVFQIRLEKDHGLILVLDTSLSMKGEKLALLAATVAAVSLSIPTAAFGVMGFDSEIHSIKRFDEVLTTQEVVERVLSIPPGGFTNIELGLRTAEKWIQSSRFPMARLILISDGRYTEGKNPVEVARGFPFIYAVKIGKDPHGRQIMREIADTGMGRFAEVREMVDLPRTLLAGIRGWVK